MANYITKINSSGTEYNIKDIDAPFYRRYRPTGTAAVTSSPYYAARYDVTDDTVTEYIDGMIVSFIVPVAGHATYGTALQINSLGYKPIVCGASTMIGTRYGVNATILAVYNSTATGVLYLGSGSQTITGAWQVMDYDADTKDAIDSYFRPYAGQAIYAYKLVMQGEDNRVYPIVTTNQQDTTQVAKTPTTIGLRPWKVWAYGTATTVSAGSQVGAQILYSRRAFTTPMYTFNEQVPARRMIYLRGTYDKNTDLFTLYNDNSSPCTSYYTFVPTNTASITLSDYFVQGYYYLLVGASYSSADYCQLFQCNPFYYFDGTNLIPIWTKIAQDSGGGGGVSQNTATGTLTSAGWTSTAEGYMQTITVTGMTSTATVWVSPQYNAVTNYVQNYATDQIVCTAQATDSLTFRRYAETSSGDIAINIVWIE